MGGVMVERVTLHNEQEVNRLGLVRGYLQNESRNNISGSDFNFYHDNKTIIENKSDGNITENNDIRYDIDSNYILEKRVIVKRAGDVIPKIVRVVRSHDIIGESMKKIEKNLTIDIEERKINQKGNKKEDNKIENFFDNKNSEILMINNESNLEASNDVLEERSFQYFLPKFCPSCGSKVEKEVGGILVRCSGGFICKAQVM